MKVSALIIGIDGWEKYTLPLVESLQLHEPDCKIVVIDNASETPYPSLPYVFRSERLCYSAAINRAAQIAGKSDWYLVLSNDVLCTGHFVHLLRGIDNAIVGPLLMHTHGWDYLEGWCVASPAHVWETLGGWDEMFQVSSWEDVDFSMSAMEHGFDVIHNPWMPFIHLDQKQRFGLVPDYWQSEKHNVRYFMSKRQRVTA